MQLHVEPVRTRQDVKMKVGDALSRLGAVELHEHQARTSKGLLHRGGYLLCCADRRRHGVRRTVKQSFVLFSRDDQGVALRRRQDVEEGERKIVFVDRNLGKLAAQYAREDVLGS